MKKRIFVCVLVFFVSQLFALNGVLSGAKGPVHVIKTQYFDIIFTDDCEVSARRIEAVCDGYYLEICSLLHTEPYQRFPVTITRQVESVNAYFTSIFYNKIVLFDSDPVEQLNMFEKSLESVFYHELTHAVTLNMKSRFFKALSFFSDVMNPAWLTLTSFWDEGATVYFESRKKTESDLPHGRLSDPFSTHIALQAKLDGKFPSWRDVTGARDTYPGGTDAYIFGSTFVQYLVSEYGEEKYSEFWKKAGSSFSLSFCAGVFKKTYGITMDRAWKNFERNLEVPRVCDAAEKTGVKKLLPQKNDVKARYSAFDSNDKMIVFYDKKLSEIKSCEFDMATGKLKNVKKILAVKNVQKLSLSSDSHLLLISRYVVKDNIKTQLLVYDMQKKRSVILKNESLFNATFIDGKVSTSKYDFVAVSAGKFPQRLEKYVYDTKTESAEKLLETTLADNEFLYSLCPAEKGKVAAIAKNGLKFTLRIYEDDFASFSDYNLNKNDSEKLPIMRNLHSIMLKDGKYAYSFSYAALGMSGKMLPRAGVFFPDENMMLQNEDFSGGVLDVFPMPGFSSSNMTVGFIDEHYDFNNLYCMTIPLKKEENKNSVSFAYGNVSVEKKQISSNEFFSEYDSARQNTVFLPVYKYNPFSYFAKGSLLPLGTGAVYSHELEEDSSGWLGATFFTSNPWNDKIFHISAGFDPSYRNFVAASSLSGGNDSFSYSLAGNVVFDGSGFKQTYDVFSVEKGLYTGLLNQFAFGAQASYFYGKQIVDDSLASNTDKSNCIYPQGKLYFSWSRMHNVKYGVHDAAGISVTPFMLFSYKKSGESYEAQKYLNPGCSLIFKAPIPLPLTVNGSFFPSCSCLASVGIKLILFSHEIQKGIPLASIYVRRFNFYASYDGKISHDSYDFWEISKAKEIFSHLSREDYSDSLSIGADFELSPNTGALTSLGFSVGNVLSYHFNKAENQSVVTFGFTFELDY